MGSCQTECIKSTGINAHEKENLSNKPDFNQKRFLNIVKEKDESLLDVQADRIIRKVIVYENGQYDGEYDEIRKRHGFGSYKWEDGSLYHGNWNDDKMSGYGKLQYSNGDIYEGNFEDNKAEDYGELHQKQGSVYKGMWKNDLKHGKGIETWRDIARYEGDFFMGDKNGYGKLTFKDGSYYHVS